VLRADCQRRTLTRLDRSPSFPQGVVGLLDASERKVTPLLFPNGRPVSTLQLLIEDWETVGERLLPARPEEEVASVEVLAPLRGRDVLCVGKNYKEHAE
jgi:2-keto-4-pentenoate hydratase/2-oxohepta-3-ene-1,7-dioic acid hydratase in catechol pathway